MISVCIDDGRIASFKWCRYLYKIGVRATIYINPESVSRFEFLNKYHIGKIRNDWKHLIANHLYRHSDCPANAISMSDIITSYNDTKKWLVDNAFTGGEEYLSIPFGRLGGRWSNAMISELLDHCKQVRNVSTYGLTDIDKTNHLYSVCDNVADILHGIRTFGKREDKVFTLTLHGNNFTSDDNFLCIANVLEEYKDYVKTVDVY